MNAVRNYVAVPFFERVPPRVMDLVLITFDNIVERALPKRDAYHFFANGVKKRQFEGPTFAEFADWHERVKNGLVERPHPSEVQSNIQAEHPSDRQQLLAAVATISAEASEKIRDRFLGRPTVIEFLANSDRDIACEVAQIAQNDLRLEQARAIVKAAYEFNQAKLAAGYAPASILLDDTILQGALQEVLSAEASATVMDADVHMTPGNKLVDLLLGEGDDDIDAKLVDCLTMDMQPELCRILTERLTKEGREN